MLTDRFFVSIVLLSAALSCQTPADRTKDPTPVVQKVAAAALPPKPVVPSAQEYFASRCVVCHGTSGAGDGPGAAAMTPKPRAFGDADWQATITDEQIAKIIAEGGPAVGKSPGMPAHPEAKAHPELARGLVAIVRGQKK